MTFAGINYLAVILAAIAGFVFGGAWYGALGKQWMAALGKSEAEVKGKGMPVGQMIITFIALLVMAWMLAGVIGHLGAGQVTLKNGIVSGAFLWFGFVLTTLVVNHGFQGQKRTLTLIDAAHWLGVVVIQGAVIGAIGV
jgi:hypothetical protein